MKYIFNEIKAFFRNWLSSKLNIQENSFSPTTEQRTVLI
jgi:hypothetical protein